MAMTSVVNEPIVATMEQALEVAHVIGSAEPNVAVGRLLDSIALFLKDRRCPALRRDEALIIEILAALGHKRALTVIGWQARRAADWDTFLFWERMEDRCRRLIADQSKVYIF